MPWYADLKQEGPTSNENLKRGCLESPQTSATVSKINDQVVNDRSLEDPTKAKKPEDWDDCAKIDDAEGAFLFISNSTQNSISSIQWKKGLFLGLKKYVQCTL